MTEKLTPKQRRIIKNFEAAVEARAFAFAGAQPPEDWETLYRNYEKAKYELEQLVKSVGLGPVSRTIGDA